MLAEGVDYRRNAYEWSTEKFENSDFYSIKLELVTGAYIAEDESEDYIKVRKMKKYELLILGSGMAGIPAMKRASELGAEVACIVGNDFGGTCLNFGCIPTKALYRFIEIKNFIENSEKFGIRVSSYEASFESAMKYKNKIIGMLKGLRKESVAEWGVEIYEGIASFISPRQVKIKLKNDNEEVIEAEKIIIATGSKTFIPEIEGIEYAIDSRQALELERKPESVFIIGSGFIGMEFATFFAELGSKVYVAERKREILDGEDRDIVALIRKNLESKGVVFLTENTAKKIEKKSKGYVVSCDCRQGINRVEVDLVMNATGRIANVDGLNLDAAKVKYSVKGIEVNEYLQTSNKHIYAAGDVVANKPKLTAVANLEGEIAVENAVNGNRIKVDYSIVPYAIFTMPILARVGINEIEAKRRGIKAEFMKVPYNKFPRGVVNGNFEESGYIKIIYDKESDDVLGATICGEDADNLIHCVAIAMKAKLKRSELASMIFFHPSLAEGIKFAAKKEALGKKEEHLCCDV